MSITQKIVKKVTQAFKFNKAIHVDISDGEVIKGWVASNVNAAPFSVVCIASKSDCVYVSANKYRPDIKKSGRNDSAYCGFEYDVSLWKDKRITVSVQPTPNYQSRMSVSPSFFIHIPKTAGTSFKRAAEDYWGESGVAKNYGDKSIETTSWVADIVLKEKNYPALYKQLQAQSISLYLGHVHAMPAANVFPIDHIVTFIRNPQTQVLSHFHHYARWHHYKGSIDEFITNKGFMNVQSRILRGLPLQLIGFVGITEHYSESLELYNSYSGFNLEARRDNQNSHHVKPENKMELLISDNNKEDFELYTKASLLFAQRLALKKMNKEWCFSFIDLENTNGIAGVAYMALDENPVKLVIKSNDEVVGECIANLHRPGLASFGVPNNGFVGFNFPFPKKAKLHNITVEVAATGQVLERKYLI